MLSDAIWHHALVSRSQGRWLDVVKSCDEMITLDTDRLAEAEGLRDQTITNVIDATDVTGHGTLWLRLIEFAVEHGNWKLAETSLGHFRDAEANDENGVTTKRLYSELVSATKAGNENGIREAINEIESSRGPISDRLMRIRSGLSNADQNSADSRISQGLAATRFQKNKVHPGSLWVEL